jgi:hypothetical protein
MGPKNKKFSLLIVKQVSIPLTVLRDKQKYLIAIHFLLGYQLKIENCIMFTR